MRRFAQAPPPDAAPPVGAPPMAPPPMGGMPPPPMGGMPGMPPPPGAPPSGPRQELIGPLDSVSKILYDYDIGTVVDGNAARDAEELALEVWKAYGGTEMGDDVESKTGNRTPESTKAAPEKQEAEHKATEDSRWQRLPFGKTIEDITTLDELSEILSGLILGAVKAKAPAAAPPGGMPPPMANTIALMRRYSALADDSGAYDVADEIDSIISSIIRPR